MNYFKKQNGSIWYFDDDQLDLVQDDMVAMTAEEIDKHINPQNYLTDIEKRAAYLDTLRPLTRRQFKLVLLENNMLTAVEDAINAISDPVLKARMQIEYIESTTFIRTSNAVIQMVGLLGLSDTQVDAMWEQALQL